VAHRVGESAWYQALRQVEGLSFTAAMLIGAVAGLGFVGGIWWRVEGHTAPGRLADDPRAAYAVPAPRSIEVVSIPSGATVALDDRAQPGVTPLAIPASAVESVRQLRVARAGYLTATRSFRDGGRERERVVVALEPAPGTIRVQGTPADAHVQLDGRAMGRLPASLGNVDTTGRHVLTASAPGHATLTRVIGSADEWLPTAERRVLSISVALESTRPAATARRDAPRGARAAAAVPEARAAERPAPADRSLAPAPACDESVAGCGHPAESPPSPPAGLKRPGWASRS
jgi:hypothetical protein